MLYATRYALYTGGVVRVVCQFIFLVLRKSSSAHTRREHGRNKYNALSTRVKERARARAKERERRNRRIFYPNSSKQNCGEPRERRKGEEWKSKNKKNRKEGIFTEYVYCLYCARHSLMSEQHTEFYFWPSEWLCFSLALAPTLLASDLHTHTHTSTGNINISYAYA